MKYLFWNTHKNDNINEVLAELIIENDISIIILAEYTANAENLIELLSLCNVYIRNYSGKSDEIKILGKIDDIDYIKSTDHYVIRVINNRDILCGVHFNSQIYSNNKEYREILIAQFIQDVKKVENELESENTIAVGDFNINPFDASFIDARHLHGMPIYEEAKRKTRTIAGQEYSMFYNPMWNLLGDMKEPYGTYYYAGSTTNNVYWHIYDQVIIRPELRSRFLIESLKIVRETDARYLLDNSGHPDKKISDHLPIIFEITEE